MARFSHNCPACDAQTAKIVAELNDEKLKRFTAFSNRKYNGLLNGWLSEIKPVVMQCLLCGHCWYNEQPSDHQLSLMYISGNSLNPNISMTRDPSPQILVEMKKLKALANQERPSYLDYGSGFGRWARAAAMVGFNVWAFEPSKSRGVEENAPFTLVHEINELRGKTFDVINLEQVLEHIPDPLETLNGIHAFCNKKTIVRVTVPNILRCDEGRDIWREWPYNEKRPHIMAPFEHLHGFTPSSLVNLIKRSGYEPLPLKKIWRHYTIFSLRNLAAKLYPKVAQTIVLVKLKKN